MNKNKKTIFIFLSQSVIVKNILRSGGFDHFKRAGYALVIFIKCKEIPDYIKKEFSGDNVTLVSIFEDDPVASKVQKILGALVSYFFWNDTSKCYFQYSFHYRDTSRIITTLHILMLRVVSASLGRFASLRKLVRRFDSYFFPEKFDFIARHFDAYKPDLVFSTSITSKIDVIFIKEAKRRGIVTVSMPKTWDTITRTYFHCIPDYFLVQNNILKEQLVKMQDIPEKNIFVIGFPEFDWYARKDVLRSREEHCARMGLDPKRPILFFGSQGKWYPHDHGIADAIYDMIRGKELVRECQLLIRPYFMQLGEDKFLKYKNMPNAAYDDTHYKSPTFTEGWDPTTDVMIDFVNTIYHSDIVIVVLSTLALDGACMDKPIINVLFGSSFAGGKDISHEMAATTHYKWIFDTGGTSVAYSPEELKKLINEYLHDPRTKAVERALLREQLCYTIDGKSSERMVKAINDVLFLEA